ncbi:MAG: hypothetical protein EXX96DRAFT_304917 [Benjaminiella poitrasii]|nr:MAG: hypothetical protein EXX96DRAFT_304917 [Benjaminiella poitrasii]
MNPYICVDYLSYKWSSTDLIQTYRDLKREKSKTESKIMKIACHSGMKKSRELKKLSIEHNRRTRYENTVWRQMAKTCTYNLSYSNPLIHPSLVNWQKESDVTWLYGPLFLPNDDLSSDYHQHKESRINPHPSLLSSFPNENMNKKATYLKSVLKRNDTRKRRTFMLQQTYSSEKSVSACQQRTVHFDPEIKQIHYLPHSPVEETLNYHHNYYFCTDSNPLDAENEEKEDDNIWELMVYIVSLMKNKFISSFFVTVFLFTHYNNKKRNTKDNTSSHSNDKIIKVQKEQQQLHYYRHMKLVQFCVSVISFTAWLLYQIVLCLASSVRTKSNLLRIKSAVVTGTATPTKNLLN